MVGPNTIAMTRCKIEGIDESDGIVRLEDIDAFDGAELSIVRHTFLHVIVLKNSAYPNGSQTGLNGCRRGD